VAAAVGLPCFVKPVKGTFSILARRFDALAELDAFLGGEVAAEFAGAYLRMFRTLLAHYADFDAGGYDFLAEEVLAGDMVTVEGYADRAGVHVLGVVDAHRDPRTGSFLRFEYPSALPAEVQARMAELARTLADAAGLRESFFNVELFSVRGGAELKVIELNPRICGQFADLYAKVDGTSSYRLALDLATGGRPEPARRRGAHAVSASIPLRTFEPVRVLDAPGPADFAAVAAMPGDVLAWNEVAVGQELAASLLEEDGHSARYGVVNLGGRDRSELAARAQRAVELLGYRFAPL
jgi:biotin carboxylase